MKKVRSTLVAMAIAATIATGVGVAPSTPASAGGSATVYRNCHRQSDDHVQDRRDCRRGFVRDLNNWGGLSVGRCAESTTFMWGSWYSSASCQIDW